MNRNLGLLIASMLIGLAIRLWDSKTSHKAISKPCEILKCNY